MRNFMKKISGRKEKGLVRKENTCTFAPAQRKRN
jgi:hypothetical protein